MSQEVRATIGVQVRAIEPPFLPEHQVLFGLQDRQGRVVDAAPATETTTFTTDVEVIGGRGAVPDFRGDHLHGRKGDRFLYLSWGIADDPEPFVMFARAKIKLNSIPAELLEADGQHGVECQVQATNRAGQPASGTITHPELQWSSSGGA